MGAKLQEEIKQSKPFRSLHAEAYLNLQKTADQLSGAVTAALKPYGVSQTQYNVLRILRGAEPEGLACREIGSRMITHDPDITRLLDRLESRGLVSRSREERDRRVIVTRITREGIRLLDELDEPIEALLQDLLKEIGIPELRTFIELLELARSG
jgi:MarR family transcriptional regulator, organic hydroperoxide resistance regulator